MSGAGGGVNMLLGILVLTLSIISSQSSCKGSSQAPKYRNLYGFKEERRSAAEAIDGIARGLRKFIAEGEELLRQELKDTTPEDDEEYDFIVVGAGSAGASIAARLSEVGQARVLLLEAGRNENLLMDVPLTVNYLQFSDVNWKYQSEPSEQYCLGMTGRRCQLPRGKVMGGSSVLNYMIATRGNRRDYDEWARAGNRGWSYRQLLPYFKKLERMAVPELRADEQMHGSAGPLHLEYPPYHTPLAGAFLQAGLRSGYPLVDYNGRRGVGFSYIQASMRNGSRVSTNRAYLHPARLRRNLLVSRLSHVERLLIDARTRRAFGVQFRKANRTIRARASKEVILSAGAIGSAQILMLSGVGPKQHLRRLGVPLVQDAPVGRNLQDHIAYGGLLFLVDQPVSIRTADILDLAKPYLSDYLNERRGPLSVPGACEALAFLDVDRPRDLDAWPSIELLFIGASPVSDPFFQRNVGISDEHWARYFASQLGAHTWTILPMLMRPRSRGRILLRSRRPDVHPKIYPNYLHEPEDVRLMIKGIRAAIQISKTEPMRRFGSKLYEALVPGCENLRYDSDDYWHCALRTFPFTIYHYSGTCKMAPDDDPTGVVNPRLQVKGIKGLRVADASIMPTIITGHPNIPVIMIAEKLADMVKEDWGYTSTSTSSL